MKSKLTVFIFILALSLVSLLKVNAVVTAPPTLVAPLPYNNLDDPNTKPVQPPTPVAPAPVTIEPSEPATPPDRIINKQPVPVPNPNPTPVNLNNYDIFGNNQPRFDFRILILFCCLCILGLVCLSAVVFVIIHKRKEKKLEASPLLKQS